MSPLPASLLRQSRFTLNWRESATHSQKTVGQIGCFDVVEAKPTIPELWGEKNIAPIIRHATSFVMDRLIKYATFFGRFAAGRKAFRGWPLARDLLLSEADTTRLLAQRRDKGHAQQDDHDHARERAGIVVAVLLGDPCLD